MKQSIMMIMVLAAVPGLTAAKGLGQKNLEQIVVVGTAQDGSLTSPSVDQAREELQRIAGGIGFVEVSDYADNFTQSLGDTLVFTPGVYADTSAQRENRISVRGSGLNASFERRGLNVYRDGVPITRASGITEFQEIDPLSIQYIEVYKGANGLQYGANGLGGAINIVTPTGRNSEHSTTLRAEYGSFGSQRFNVSTTGRSGDWDYYIAGTDLSSDGYRAHSAVDSWYGFGNVGLRLSDSIETRFYITALQDEFELAGSTDLDSALNAPETAVAGAFIPPQLPFLGGPGLYTAIDDDWDRNLTVNRVSNRTKLAFDAWSLEMSAWASERELDHAITRFAGVVVQDEDETGFSVVAGNQSIAEEGVRWLLGMRYNQSDNDAKLFRNEFGVAGMQTSQDKQSAENLIGFAQLTWPLSARMDVIFGAQYNDATRENQHIPLNERDMEDDSGSLRFDEFAPRLGVLWQISADSQLYANLSRAYEVPGISELTSAGVLPFDPLLAQQATTLEFGSRGQIAVGIHSWSWDVSVYRAEIENEFIDLTNGFVTNTVNSESDTIHQGLELGIDWLPAFNSLSTHAIQLAWRHVLTVNDFKFQAHPVYGNNTLAGVPETSYLTELSLTHERWRAGLSVRHVVDGPFVDYANTTQTDGYTLLGFNASWTASDNITLFMSAENATDERYVSNVGTVGVGNRDGQLFTPGQGRALYAGVTLAF
jgi:iron complex outermembrane receptor protein